MKNERYTEPVKLLHRIFSDGGFTSVDLWNETARLLSGYGLIGGEDGEVVVEFRETGT